MKSINYIITYLSSLFIELSERIDNFIGSNTKNLTSDGIFAFLDAYKEFISHLSFDQLYIMTHLCFLSSIFLAVWNLASVFYGDALIVKLDLENRLPKLAKFIRLRRKFQQYYFGINLILIFVIAIMLFLVNLFILIYVK